MRPGRSRFQLNLYRFTERASAGADDSIANQCQAGSRSGFQPDLYSFTEHTSVRTDYSCARVGHVSGVTRTSLKNASLLELTIRSPINVGWRRSGFQPDLYSFTERTSVGIDYSCALAGRAPSATRTSLKTAPLLELTIRSPINVRLEA
jgi:hypothetical protein